MFWGPLRIRLHRRCRRSFPSTPASPAGDSRAAMPTPGQDNYRIALSPFGPLRNRLHRRCKQAKPSTRASPARDSRARKPTPGLGRTSTGSFPIFWAATHSAPPPLTTPVPSTPEPPRRDSSEALRPLGRQIQDRPFPFWPRYALGSTAAENDRRPAPLFSRGDSSEGGPRWNDKSNRQADQTPWRGQVNPALYTSSSCIRFRSRHRQSDSRGASKKRTEKRVERILLFYARLPGTRRPGKPGRLRLQGNKQRLTRTHSG